MHYNSSVAEHWTILSYALYVVCMYFVSLIQLLLPNLINHYYSGPVFLTITNQARILQQDFQIQSGSQSSCDRNPRCHLDVAETPE